jgi:hypothetical protein
MARPTTRATQKIWKKPLDKKTGTPPRVFPLFRPPYTSPQFVGLVTDPDSNPVPDVQIVGNAPGVTCTDGRYAVDFADIVSINFEADFVPPLSTGLAILHVSAGDALPTAVVKDVVLPRAGKVAGTVLGASGSPIAGASVTVVETSFPFALSTLRTVTPGADGTFEAGQLLARTSSKYVFPMGRRSVKSWPSPPGRPRRWLSR